jgi:hypothetical protein
MTQLCFRTAVMRSTTAPTQSLFDCSITWAGRDAPQKSKDIATAFNKHVLEVEAALDLWP